jgi:hypothetical protein
VVVERAQKITFAEMRDTGVRGALIYCTDNHCSHSIAISGHRWPDHLRLSDIERLFVCRACGQRGPTCGRAASSIPNAPPLRRIFYCACPPRSTSRRPCAPDTLLKLLQFV